MKKQILQSLALLFMLGMVLPSFAQQTERVERKERREIPSPENNARRIMKEFKVVFKLTDKDYDKVYNLYLKQEQAMMPSQNKNSGMPSHRGGMGNPGGRMNGGFGGEMNFPQMGGGMPPQGGPGMQRGNMPEEMKSMMEEMRKEQESKRQKATKKLDKKMKKILKEQYSQWQEWESKRISKQKDEKPAPRMQENRTIQGI